VVEAREGGRTKRVTSKGCRHSQRGGDSKPRRGEKGRDDQIILKPSSAEVRGGRPGGAIRRKSLVKSTLLSLEWEKKKPDPEGAYEEIKCRRQWIEETRTSQESAVSKESKGGFFPANRRVVVVLKSDLVK